MRRAHRTEFSVILAAAALAAGGGPALAAPPPNDARAQAQAVQLGSTLSGTTAEATNEPLEPAPACGPLGPSVWYRVDPSASGRAIAFLQAHGDLDVVVDVFRRARSELQSLNCDVSDRRGQSSTDFAVAAGGSYLIRVSQRPESVAGTFALTVDLAQPEERPPGRHLPRAGASGDVRRVFEPSNAWSARLRAGRTYRVNLAARGCQGLSIYPPGTSSFDQPPLRTLGCGGYAVLTPAAGQGGRYSFVVRPGRSRAAQPYHLELGPASPDDTSPGRVIGNHAVAHGGLDARRLDVVDLYHFDIPTASITELRLATGANFSVTLLTQWGRRLGRGTELTVRTPPGHYFAAVRAARGETGRYRLARASRTITRTRLTATPGTAMPGAAVSLTTQISPAVSGPVTVVIERFDPLAGYQFLRRYKVRAMAGRATVRLVPPAVGHYRAMATFAGTRDAATSGTGWRPFAVEVPLPGSPPSRP